MQWFVTLVYWEEDTMYRTAKPVQETGFVIMIHHARNIYQLLFYARDLTFFDLYPICKMKKRFVYYRH